MIEVNQMRSSKDGKEKAIILDKRQDFNAWTYYIKVMGRDPYWVSAATIEFYWPVICG